MRTSRPSALILFWLTVALLPAPTAWADEGDADERLEAAAKEVADGLRSDDLERRIEAAEAACENPHASLTSPLIKALRDDSIGVREPAMRALALREDEASRRKAAKAIGDRLPRLERDAGSKDEVLVAIDALQTLGQKSSIKPLLDDIDIGDDLEIVEAKLMAVGHVPDAEAVDRLIQFLAKGKRGDQRKQRGAAAKALQYATGQRFGGDPDQWRAWWRDARKTFDFEAMALAREEAKAEAEAKRAEKEAREKEREARRHEKRERKNRKKEPAPQEGDA